ncbi:MAG: hypothetical protein AABZ49_03195, partial [Thermoproteota archaeon]
MIKINRDVTPGTYSIDDIFDGLKHLPILMDVFETQNELDDVFSKTSVVVEEKDHYMFVKNKDATIVIGFDHLK